MSNKELLIKLSYSKDSNICYYYTDYTFIETDSSGVLCSGKWRVTENQQIEFMTSFVDTSACMNSDWVLDDFTDEIISEIVERELLA